MSARPASRAGVVDAADRRIVKVAAGELDQVAHCLVEAQHAAREHAAARARPAVVDDDNACRRSVYVAVRQPECGHRVRHQRDPIGTEGLPRKSHHRRIDVDAIDDQAGDQRSGRSATAPAASRCSCTDRTHRVEQVGHARCRPARTAASRSLRIGIGVARRRRTTPRSTSSAMTSSAPVSSGAMVTSATPDRDSTSHLGERRRPKVCVTVRARTHGVQERPLEVHAQRALHPRLSAERTTDPSPPIRVAMSASGDEITVGMNDVTPHLRQERRPPRRRARAAVVRSTPTAPLTCRSTKPGRTEQPVASSVPRSVAMVSALADRR